MREMTKEEIREHEKLVQNKNKFREELIKLINHYNLENDSNTPDYIIADFMINAYLNMNDIIFKRDEWYGVHLEPGNKYFEENK